MPGRSQRWGFAPPALWCILVLAAGCSPEVRYRVLSGVFDGVPPPGTPPKERLRHPRSGTIPEPAPPPVPVPGAELAGAEIPEEPEDLRPHYETFAELVAAFPADASGGPDWVEAVRRGLADPLPSIEPGEPLAPFPLNVRLRSAVPGFDVVFPHAAHTYWLRCDNCHQEIFVMRAGANPISMTKIFRGEACGRCHGTVAFAAETGCPRCHVRMAGPAG